MVLIVAHFATSILRGSLTGTQRFSGTDRRRRCNLRGSGPCDAPAPSSCASERRSERTTGAPPNATQWGSRRYGHHSPTRGMGWHVATLERHLARRYERRNGQRSESPSSDGASQRYRSQRHHCCCQSTISATDLDCSRTGADGSQPFNQCWPRIQHMVYTSDAAERVSILP